MSYIIHVTLVQKATKANNYHHLCYFRDKSTSYSPIHLSTYLSESSRKGGKRHIKVVHLLKHGRVCRVWVQSDPEGVNSKNKLDYIITAQVIILFLPLEIIAQNDVEDGKQILSRSQLPFQHFFFHFSKLYLFFFSSASKLQIHDLAAGQSRSSPLDAFTVRNRHKPSSSDFFKTSNWLWIW